MNAAPDPGPWLRRLASRYDPSAWVGIVIRAVPAATIERDGAVIHTPDHYLGAAWPPAITGPSRWPDIVVIGSPAASNALAELFPKLPPSAKLYLAAREQVDVVLAATILRNGDRNLEGYQQAALDAFIAEESRREREIVAMQYTDRDDGYERFRARVAPDE